MRGLMPSHRIWIWQASHYRAKGWTVRTDVRWGWLLPLARLVPPALKPIAERTGPRLSA